MGSAHVHVCIKICDTRWKEFHHISLAVKNILQKERKKKALWTPTVLIWVTIWLFPHMCIVQSPNVALWGTTYHINSICFAYRYLIIDTCTHTYIISAVILIHSMWVHVLITCMYMYMVGVAIMRMLKIQIIFTIDLFSQPHVRSDRMKAGLPGLELLALLRGFWFTTLLWHACHLSHGVPRCI